VVWLVSFLNWEMVESYPELLYFGMRVTVRSNVSDFSCYMKQRENISLSYGMKQRTSTPFLKHYNNCAPMGVGGGGVAYWKL
jgi:hypothetical protein